MVLYLRQFLNLYTRYSMYMHTIHYICVCIFVHNRLRTHTRSYSAHQIDAAFLLYFILLLTRLFLSVRHFIFHFHVCFRYSSKKHWLAVVENGCDGNGKCKLQMDDVSGRLLDKS